MEYVKVTFPTRRRLYIDGEENGVTNKLLRIDAGTHVFDLGQPDDYQPRSRRVVVRDTTAGKPMQVRFRKKKT